MNSHLQNGFSLLNSSSYRALRRCWVGGDEEGGGGDGYGEMQVDWHTYCVFIRYRIIKFWPNISDLPIQRGEAPRFLPDGRNNSSKDLEFID